jgi:hypothetical protein
MNLRGTALCQEPLGCSWPDRALLSCRSMGWLRIDSTIMINLLIWGRAFAGRVCACVRAAEVKHNRAELMAAKLGLSGGSDDEEVEGLLPSPPLSVPPLGGVGPLRGSGGDGDDGWVLSAAEREGSAVGGDGLSRGWAAERLKGRGRGKGAVRDRPA